MKIQDPITNQNLSLIGRYVNELPNWVKESHLEQLFEPVPAPLFAADNSLPCHTKLATFLSRAYFTVQQSQLESNRAGDIEAKLASFERQWKIDPEEINSLVSQIKTAMAVPTVDELANKLLNKVAAGSGMQLDHLVTACRELVSQGCTNQKVHKLAMITPVAGFKRFVRNLAEQYGDPRAKEAAVKLLSGSHSKSQEYVTDVLVGVQLDPRKFIAKVAELSPQRAFDVQIDNVDYPREQVMRELPKIAAVTGLPVICGDLDLPAVGWEDVISACDKPTQRRIQSCVC